MSKKRQKKPSCLDLGDIANKQAPWTQVRRWSLAALTSFAIGKDLEKGPVRLSNWELSPLLDEQREYATEDAWVALEIHQALLSAPQPSSLSSDLPTIPENGAPEYSDDDRDEHQHEEGRPKADDPPSLPSDKDPRTPVERARDAAQIAEEGLELDSNWLLRPPVRDEDFISRLNSEKGRRTMPTRIKLDPFHWMDRYARVISKNHVLFPIFMACLRDALFFLEPGDVQAFREEMVQRGMDPDAAARVPKHFFTKRTRCRRKIPPRLELAVRVQAVFELFTGLCDDGGIPLITPKTQNRHKQCMEHVWCGCLSDIPGMPMYYERETKSGFPRYVTLRGTSQLEGYHRWLRACISGSQLAPGLFSDLLLHFNYRWNVRCGIRSRGERDQATYSHWVLESIMARSGNRAVSELFPGLIVAVTRTDAEAQGIEIDAVGFHAERTWATPATDDDPVDESDAEDEANLGCDSDEDDDVGDDDAKDEDLRPMDVPAFEKSITGNHAHAPILAASSVSTLGEIDLIVRLVAKQIESQGSQQRSQRHRKNQWGIDYDALAKAYNRAVLARFSSLGEGDCDRAHLRLKSQAHLKQFIQKVDDSFVVAHSLSGVRGKLADLRRRLRDDTSGPVPQSLKRIEPNSSCCSSSLCAELEDQEFLTQVGSEAIPQKKQKRARSCPECKKSGRDMSGHIYKQFGFGKNLRYSCSNPECSRFDANLWAGGDTKGPEKRKYKKGRRGRTCVICKSPTKRTGFKKGSRVLCTNSKCPKSIP